MYSGNFICTLLSVLMSVPVNWMLPNRIVLIYLDVPELELKNVNPNLLDIKILFSILINCYEFYGTIILIKLCNYVETKVL